MPVTIRDEHCYEIEPSQNWWRRLLGGAAQLREGSQPPTEESFLSFRLKWIARHQLGQARLSGVIDEDIRAFAVPLIEAFKLAGKSYPLISIDPEIMAGAPCIAKTRIPVYLRLFTG